MKTLDAMSVRKQFWSVLDEVFYTKRPIIVERRGQKKAMIVPLDSVGLFEVDEAKLSPENLELLDQTLKMEDDDFVNL